jgi:hypothetical protein
MGKIIFSSAAFAAVIGLVWLIGPAAAITAHQETDCTGTGPCFEAVNSPGGVGVAGGSQGGSSGAGVSGVRSGGTGGYGVQASNSGGTGLFAQGNPAIVAGSKQPGNPLLFQGLGANAPVFHVDSKGNGYFAGKVAAKHVTEQATSTGQLVTTYATQGTSPAVEDFGETVLAGGRGYVRFDARFASVMQGTRYLVFVTPQGPVAGTLYVTQKTSFGFAVREAPPGRSNVAVDYRIVVRPFGSTEPRLPLVGR